MQQNLTSQAIYSSIRAVSVLGSNIWMLLPMAIEMVGSKAPEVIEKRHPITTKNLSQQGWYLNNLNQLMLSNTSCFGLPGF
jgi:hypothetical protein